VNHARLSERLPAATRAGHAAAERSGLMASLLRGQIDRADYCILLRNLHALYETLETALDRHAGTTAVAPVRFPALYRSAALVADLHHLADARWATLPIARATHDYCRRIRELSETQPGLLVAHAYVRYLGDLSGGQILRAVIRRSLALAEEAGTAFYAFGHAADVEARKAAFRSGLDALPMDAAGTQLLVAEANAAFIRHVQLFEELDQMCVAASQPARSS